MLELLRPLGALALILTNNEINNFIFGNIFFFSEKLTFELNYTLI